MKLTLALLAALPACLAAAVRRQSASPLPPSQDPWYTAPSDYTDYLPGAVLRVRDVDLSVITNVSQAWQILYRTTDSRDLPTFAVTTLLAPANFDNSKLLIYGLPYDSADVDASPSYSLYTGGGAFGLGEVSTALGRGWAVSIADYEGPKASFTAGVISGQATLDSVRAIFECGNFGLEEESTIYALWGYSGGALANEWASELQSSYAPDLHFSGAALGGLTPNISSVLYTINGTIYAGLAPSGILGISSQFPDLESFVQDELVPATAAQFDSARNETLAQTVGTFAGKDIGAYFRDGFATLNAPVVQSVIASDGIMGTHGVPTFPLFVYKAIGDDISVVADTDALINKYCAAGATIDYQRNTVGNHAAELNNGRARALAFLDSVFAGTYSASGCQISNVTVSA